MCDTFWCKAVRNLKLYEIFPRTNGYFMHGSLVNVLIFPLL